LGGGGGEREKVRASDRECCVEESVLGVCGCASERERVVLERVCRWVRVWKSEKKTARASNRECCVVIWGGYD